MTMKKIALALLAIPAMASTECGPESPWGSQSNFALEFAGGSSTMHGAPYSNTTTPRPEQEWTDLRLGANSDATGTTFNIEIDTPKGYTANWHRMVPNAGRLGFAGQLNLHYTAVQGHFAGGVYAGVGYNGAHASSSMKNFDNSVIKNTADIFMPESDNDQQYGNAVTISFPELLVDAGIPKRTSQKTGSVLSTTASRNNNMPKAKATVSSGLMFSAGTRMGAMIGNVFPHFRLGWAAYEFKAHMTNQMPAGFETKDILFASSNLPLEITDGYLTSNPGDSNTTAGVVSMGVGQNFGGIEPLSDLPPLVKTSSKGSKWANALTLGGGVDWAFQKMTLGFYYQAAICQRVTFDKWNKKVSPGLTSSSVNFPTESGNIDPNVLSELSSGGVYNTYGEATPKVSISPVISTVMLSMKYVMNKA